MYANTMTPNLDTCPKTMKNPILNLTKPDLGFDLEHVPDLRIIPNANPRLRFENLP